MYLQLRATAAAATVQLLVQDWTYKLQQCFPLSPLLLPPSFLSASHQRLLLSSADLESLMKSSKVYGNS